MALSETVTGTWAAALVAVLVVACTGGDGDRDDGGGGGEGAEGSVHLAFSPDPEGEAYLCTSFDVGLLGGGDLRELSLVARGGPIVLHHVSLYAVPAAFPAGPVACVEMPEGAVPLHVWAAGDDVELPDGVSLVVPRGTQRLVVQAHAVRTSDGPAQQHELVLAVGAPAEHRAAWLPLRAPTPALRPHHVEESAATCTVSAELHVLSTWPHMHQAGIRFVASAGDAAEPFVVVDPWAFEAQRRYALDLVLAPGARIETRCTWRNDTDVTILPGPSIADEMCGQSLTAWPAEAAHCE